MIRLNGLGRFRFTSLVDFIVMWQWGWMAVSVEEAYVELSDCLKINKSQSKNKNKIKQEIRATEWKEEDPVL